METHSCLYHADQRSMRERSLDDLLHGRQQERVVLQEEVEGPLDRLEVWAVDLPPHQPELLVHHKVECLKKALLQVTQRSRHKLLNLTVEVMVFVGQQLLDWLDENSEE